MNPSPKFSASFFLFAALPVVFFLLFGFHGMDAADRGFIPALAYRILSGEVIYHDFFYVRPPLSPYLHTFEMALFPASMEMMAYRFFFYVFMWLPIYWSIRSLEQYFDFSQMGVSPWMLGAIGFIFSVHNFFAAPWHTVDGIFFSALGFYLISRGPHAIKIVLGLFCFGLAAMAKQPFGIVPIIGIALLAYLQGWKKALVGATGALALAGGCWALIELALTPGYNFTQEMLSQTTGVSSLNEMRWGGYQLYVRPAAAALGLGLTAWLLAKYALKLQRPGWPMAILALFGFAFMGAGLVWLTVQKGTFIQPKDGFYHGLVFLGGAIAGISFLKRDRKGHALLLAMTAVAWASGISWGYAIPVLYCFPAVFAIAYFLGNVAGFHAPKWYWPLILSMAFASVCGLNWFVYHDAVRPEITHDLGEVFPKLSHIRAGDEQYANYRELQQLHARYGDNFTVLPSLPAAHYVTNTQSPIQVDWAHDAEVNYKSGIDKLIATLEQKQTTVFAMRTELGRAEEDGHYRCSTLKYVLDNWTRVDSSSQFYVYKRVGQ
jgi:hypothetical protein